MTAHVRRPGSNAWPFSFPLKREKGLVVVVEAGGYVGNAERYPSPVVKRSLSIRATYPQPRRSQLQVLYILYIGCSTVSPYETLPFHRG